MSKVSFSMDGVAKAINSQGIKASVQHTGGGCATLYLGETNAEDYYSLAAGAGSFESKDWSNPVGYWSEFWIGPEDNVGARFETSGGYYKGEQTIEALVEFIVNAYKSEKAQGN